MRIPFLGLVVIDEQHRFGVDQRGAIASGIHTLVMTATTIPRTIAMSVFGDLDVSTLKELVRRWYPQHTFVKNSTHQALADIQDSIAELRHYREHIFRA